MKNKVNNRSWANLSNLSLCAFAPLRLPCRLAGAKSPFTVILGSSGALNVKPSNPTKGAAGRRTDGTTEIWADSPL